MTVRRQTTVDLLRPSDRARIEALIEAAVPSVAPAVSVVIRHAGLPVYGSAFGWLDPETRARPVDIDTLFDLASLSKLFTATVFLALASNGRVGLDDSVATVIPEFGDAGPRAVDGGQDPLSRRLVPVPREREHQTVDPSAVTFGQLLTHTSGMAPWRSVFEVIDPIPPLPCLLDPLSIDDRLRIGLRAVYDYPFVARPGEETHYSDLGFMVLGEAVRRLAGRPLGDAIRGGISGPLGLQSIGFRPLPNGLSRVRIAPTSIDDDWRRRRCWGEVEDENAAALGGEAGHAGLFGSAGDLSAFGQAWLKRDGRLGIEDSIFAAATTRRAADPGASRGLGWQLHGPGAGYLDPFSTEAYGHTGFTGTSLAIDPTRDLVVVMLTNRVYDGRSQPGIDEFRSALHAACIDAVSRPLAPNA